MKTTTWMRSAALSCARRALVAAAMVLGFAAPNPGLSQESEGDSGDNPKLVELQDRLAELRAKGEYQEGIEVARQCVELAEAKFGPTHVEVATTLNKLAEMLREQGEYRQAEPLYKRSLAIREKARGPDHPEVATSLNNLAVLHMAQGDYAGAESLFKRSLAIAEKALGPDHPDFASSLNNLAEIYKAQGAYAKAKPLFERSLAITEKALGPEHPDVANSLNNLAGLYATQGDCAGAEPLYKRSLAIAEKALGPDHPAVAITLNNLAGLYEDQGDYGRAEPLYERSLAIREKALGPDHPSVALVLNNLAGLYKTQGDYAGAEPLYERSLAIREKVLGPDHPAVASSLITLAALFEDQGAPAKAEPLYERALAINEKAFGPENPDVALVLNNLASLYRTQGDHTKAKPLYERALAIWEKVHGHEHPDVAHVLNNLALLYKGQGKYAEAEPLCKRSLAIYEEVRGSDHPDVAKVLENLAEVYRKTKRNDEAEALEKRAAGIRQRRERNEGEDADADQAAVVAQDHSIWEEIGADERAEFAALAKESLGALIQMAVVGEDIPGTVYNGAFVSENGLALIDLSALAWRIEPRAWVAGHQFLELEAIHWIFPEHELALVKFDHRPKKWMELSSAVLKLGDAIALVAVDSSGNPLSGDAGDPFSVAIPPVVGRVMARRTGTTSNHRVPGFRQVISLGAGLAPLQARGLAPAVFAIERQGRIVAWTAGVRTVGRQNLILLAPGAPVAEKVRKLAGEAKPIPFPLPEDLNPIDLALLDPVYGEWHGAVQRHDQRNAELHLETLRKRYPMSGNLSNRIGLEPGPETPAAARVGWLQARAMRRMEEEDSAGAIEDCKAAIALSPEDFPDGRTLLANIYLGRGRFRKAERILREAYEVCPEVLDLVELLELLLIKQGKLDEADELAERIEALERIYRRP